jgi:hypothetical protein
MAGNIWTDGLDGRVIRTWILNTCVLKGLVLILLVDGKCM